MAANPGRLRSRRPAWQIVVRWLTVSALTVSLLYITLPLWLPTNWLCRAIQRDLSQSLGLPVDIQSVSVSWADGVRLEGMTVRNAPEVGGNLLNVRQIQAEFAPLGMLWNRRIGYLDVAGACLTLRVDADGRIHLPPLAALREGVQADRITIRESQAALQMPDGEVPLQLDVADLVILPEGSQAGRISMSAFLRHLLPTGQAGPTSPDDSARVTLLVTGSSPGAAATTRLSFSDLQLDHLNLPRWLHLPLERLTGRGAGEVVFRIDPKMAIDNLQLNVTVDNLTVCPIGGSPLGQIASAEMRMDAAIDPGLDPFGNGDTRIEIRSVQVTLPGMDFRGSADITQQALAGKPQGFQSLKFAGTFDPQAMASLWGIPPVIAGGSIEGRLPVEVSIDHVGGDLRLSVSSNGSNCIIRKGQRLSKPSGEPMDLKLTGVYDTRDGNLNSLRAAVRLGQNTAAIEGTVDNLPRFLRHWADGPSSGSSLLQDLSALDIHGSLEIRELTSLRRLDESVDALLKPADLQGQLNGTWSLYQQDGTRLRLGLKADQASTFRWTGVAEKPAGMPANLMLAARVNGFRMGLSDIDVDLNVGEGRFSADRCQLTRLTSNGSFRLSGDFDCDGIEHLLGLARMHLPDSVELRGAANGRFEFSESPHQRLFRLHGDLDRLHTMFGQAFQKPAGHACMADLMFCRREENTGPAVIQASASLSLPKADVNVAANWPDTPEPAEIRISEIRAIIDDAAWLAECSPALGMLLHKPAVAASQPAAPGSSPSTDRDDDSLAAPTSRPMLSGPVGLNASGTLSDGGLALRAHLNADGLAVRTGDASIGNKPTGSPMQFDLDVNVRQLLHNNGNWDVDLKSFSAALGKGRLEASGHLLSDDRACGYSGTVRFEDFGTTLAGKEIGLNGQIDLDGLRVADDGWNLQALRVNDLQFRVGQNNGWAFVDVQNLPAKPQGRFELLCPRLDDKDLGDWAARLLVGESPQASSAPGTASAPATTPDEILAQGRRSWRNVCTALADTDLTGRIAVDWLRTYDPVVKRFYTVHHTNADVSIRDGQLNTSYATSLNGGSYRKSFTAFLRQPDEPIRMKADIRQVKADEDIQPQLSLFFPGNTVHGTFSRTEDFSIQGDRMMAHASDPSFPLRPAGPAVTVTTDGIIVGRSAPTAVTTVFPGLNLTEYAYKTMTAFADFHADGSADNDMVFNGHLYDMYMNGVTTPDNIGRYEIGVILLPSAQTAEENHRFRLGRLWLLKFKARIENGQLYDIEVSYPWPHEAAAALVLENNPIYQRWIRGK